MQKEYIKGALNDYIDSFLIVFALLVLGLVFIYLNESKDLI